MLGSLARKLRIFGFDTAYYREGSDSNLLALAEAEGRAILTSDRRLSVEARSKGVPVVLIEGRSDAARLRSLAGEARLASLSIRRGESRCAACNGELASVDKSEVSSRVPKNVLARHRMFYECRACAGLYWKGGHWSRLRRLSRLLGSPPPPRSPDKDLIRGRGPRGRASHR